MAAPGEGGRLKRFARAMRREPSDAERKLWKALRDRRFARLKFRRQVPMGRYIADFVSHEARLIIEVDGGQHCDSARDRMRDRWFAERGYVVLRYWNPDVLANVEGVLTDIASHVERAAPSSDARRRRAPPSPARGEGQ